MVNVVIFVPIRKGMVDDCLSFIEANCKSPIFEILNLVSWEKPFSNS